MELNAWQGDACFVIGGGPSVNCHDLRDLPGRVIAINRALELWHAGKLQKPDIWLFHDKTLYAWTQQGELRALRKAIEAYDGPKVTRYVEAEKHIHMPDVQRLPVTNEVKLAESFDAIPVATNSGFFAVNLAYLLGCEPIVLVGFDCNTQGRDPRHGKVDRYHDGYPLDTRPGEQAKYARHFAELAEQMEGKRTVINMSPLTELDCWPVLNSLGELVESYAVR